MKSISTKTVGVAVAAAAVIGLGVAGVAQAEDASTATSTPNPTSTSTPDTSRGGWGHMGQGRDRMDRGARGDQLASALASKLGLDETKVRSALTAARTELFDSLKAQRQKGQPPTEADRTAREDALATALAKQLGVDTAKVKSALTSIQQEFQAQRFAEHEADLKARLDQAVKAGTLTQAEADAVLKAAKAGVIGMGGGRH